MLVLQVMWPRTATEDDVTRWHSQGFVFQDAPPFGLEQVSGAGLPAWLLLEDGLTDGRGLLLLLLMLLGQGHGGPCGVLAAVQGEVLRLLVFGGGQQKQEEVRARAPSFMHGAQWARREGGRASLMRGGLSVCECMHDAGGGGGAA